MCRPSVASGEDGSGGYTGALDDPLPAHASRRCCAPSRSPSAALAQGAGDEQYQDPFGDEQSQSEPTPTADRRPRRSPLPRSPPRPSRRRRPRRARPRRAASQAEQLPRTGADAGWLALAGAVLLAAGIALRRADLQR